MEIRRGKTKVHKVANSKRFVGFSNWGLNYCILVAAITNYQTADYPDYFLYLIQNIFQIGLVFEKQQQEYTVV